MVPGREQRMWFAVLMGMAGLCVALATPPARADIRYTTETRMGAEAEGKDAAKEGKDGAKMPSLRATTYIKGKRERVETAMDMGAVKTNTVTLTLCDARRIVTLDPDLKLYTSAPMDGAADGAAGATGDGGAGAGAGAPPDPKKKEDTGRVIVTYAVQDLGTEKVNDIEARHFIVTMTMERSGCAGKGRDTMKMETWVAPGSLGGLDCPERAPSAAPRESRNEKGCRITTEMRGDIEKLKDVFSGIVVRQRMYSGDKVAMTQEVKEISSAPLDESLFAAPADYRQVTPQELADARRKAMMAALNAPKESATSTTGASGTTGATGASGENAPKKEEPKKRRGGLLGGLGGALGGRLGGSLGGGLGSVGSGVLSGLGGMRGLGGIASLFGSGILGGWGGASPIYLPGGAGETLSLVGSLMNK